jgi:hypothetical protein
MIAPLTVGTRVAQPTFGAGTIVESTDVHTVIDFDAHGRRIFASKILVLQPLTVPLKEAAVIHPAKPAKKKTAKGKPTKRR